MKQYLIVGLTALCIVQAGFTVAQVPARLVSKESIVKRIKKGTLKSINLLNYKDFLAETKKAGNGNQQNTEISPNRKVYVVVVEVEDLVIRTGRFDKATVTTLIDAQTGQNLSVDVVGSDSVFHPDRPGVKLEELPPEVQQRLRDEGRVKF